MSNRSNIYDGFDGKWRLFNLEKPTKKGSYLVSRNAGHVEHLQWDGNRFTKEVYCNEVIGNKSIGGWRHDSSYKIISIGDVTAWMPYPKPVLQKHLFKVGDFYIPRDSIQVLENTKIVTSTTEANNLNREREKYYRYKLERDD